MSKEMPKTRDRRDRTALPRAGVMAPLCNVSVMIRVGQYFKMSGETAYCERVLGYDRKDQGVNPASKHWASPRCKKPLFAPNPL